MRLSLRTRRQLRRYGRRHLATLHYNPTFTTVEEVRQKMGLRDHHIAYMGRLLADGSRMMITRSYNPPGTEPTYLLQRAWHFTAKRDPIDLERFDSASAAITRANQVEAIIPPLFSRRQVFHLLCQEPGQVVGSQYTPPGDYEVGLVMRPVADGDFHEEPTLTTSFDNSDFTDFLQCIVDEAAKIGIVASGLRDRDAEVAALKHHLDDMRRLAMGTKYK